MDVLLEQIKQKPNLKLLVDELNQSIKDEDKRREEFYNTITESDKAEFINGEIIMHSPVKLRHAGASILPAIATNRILFFLRKKKRTDFLRIKCFFLRPI